MKVSFQFLCATLFVLCQVSEQYNNSPYHCGSSVQSGAVYDVVSPCSCSYSGGSDDDNDYYGSTSSCSCQSGDQTCDCVLGCGCTNTGDNECSDVPLLNDTLTNEITEAPYKILAIWFGQDTAQIDNVCLTYFALTGTDSYVVYISTVLIDGSNSIETYIVHDGGPGVNWARGPESVFIDKPFGEVPGCVAYTVYRCYLWGDSAYPGNRDYEYPTFVSGPLCADRDSSCGRTAAQTLIDAGYNQKYWIPPEKLPYQCVLSQSSTPTANTCVSP